MTAVDWAALRTAARGAAARAYAPYSGLHIGAAGLDAGGRIHAAANVENASYGLSLCAECGLVSMLHVLGGHGPDEDGDAGSPRLLAVSVVAGDGAPLAPCGRCRQLLLEAGGPELLVDSGEGRPPTPLGELLPGAFDAGELRRAG